MNVSVFGCGAWGTVLAELFAQSVEIVWLVGHTDELVEEINKKHTNVQYLPTGTKLSANVKAVHLEDDLTEVLEAPIIVVAVASPYYESVLKKMTPKLTSHQILVSATKGMDMTTGRSTLEIAQAQLPKVFYDSRYVVLTGPNLAFEIAQKKPAAAVLAGGDPELVKQVQRLLSSPVFRVYTVQDRIGAAYGGIIKNVIAIAAGLLDAKQLGANAKSALLVRGMAEMRRFAVAKGAQEETLFGLSGFGDLITTTGSHLSRNYTVGFRLGQGASLVDIQASMISVVEGVRTCQVIHGLAAKLQLDMPINEAVYKVLYEGANIDEVIRDLMTRDLKQED